MEQLERAFNALLECTQPLEQFLAQLVPQEPKVMEKEHRHALRALLEASLTEEMLVARCAQLESTAILVVPQCATLARQAITSMQQVRLPALDAMLAITHVVGLLLALPVQLEHTAPDMLPSVHSALQVHTPAPQQLQLARHVLLAPTPPKWERLLVRLVLQVRPVPQVLTPPFLALL